MPAVPTSEFTRNRMGLDNVRNTDVETAAEVTRPPQPGEESAGPGMFDLVMETRRAQQVGKFLLEEASHLLAKRTIVTKENGMTNAAGLLDMVLYRVPFGFEFAVTRLNVEAVGFSPALPYTNAAGWIALYGGERFAQGAIVDFLPNPPVASGAILPATLTDGVDQAGIFRSGESISLHIETGPATTMIYTRLQGLTRAV